MTCTDIRLVRPEEAPQFRAIRLRSLKDHPEAYHSTYKEWDGPLWTFVQRIEENRLVGAFHENTLVGIVLLALQARKSAQTRHKCEFWSVYLAPEHRGRGLARRMLERAIEEARSLGFEAAVLTVNAENAGAKALYESLGFVVYGLERRAVRRADGRYGDDVLMELRLRN